MSSTVWDPCTKCGGAGGWSVRQPDGSYTLIECKECNGAGGKNKIV